MVFEQLSDLDDAVCLARTCRTLGGVYSQYKVTILWSIIVPFPALLPLS